MPVWQAGFVDLFGPHRRLELANALEKPVPALDAATTPDAPTTVSTHRRSACNNLDSEP
jgi:hypothetical protein